MDLVFCSTWRMPSCRVASACAAGPTSKFHGALYLRHPHVRLLARFHSLAVSRGRCRCSASIRPTARRMWVVCFIECVAKYLSSNVYQRKGVLNDHHRIFLKNARVDVERSGAFMPTSLRASAGSTLPCAEDKRSLSRGMPTGRWTGRLSRRVRASERRSRNISCDLWLDSYAVCSRATHVKYAR